MHPVPNWIAVDWGTSNVRLWGIGDEESVLFSADSNRGMGEIGPSDYLGTLTSLADLPVSDGGKIVDVVICGMAGARQGWREAPYIETPTSLAEVARLAISVETPAAPFRVRLLPGLCQRGEPGADVMRGEETQLLGLMARTPGFSGIVCMPGTHTKWVELRHGRVETFSTAMAGELHAILGRHSVLRHSLGGPIDAAEEKRGFSEGLERSLADPSRLLSLLFRTRAANLLENRTSGWCAGYLSGLLIGADVAGGRGRGKELCGQPVVLIGTSHLSALYAEALTKLGIPSETLDAKTATLAGLAEAHRQISHD